MVVHSFASYMLLRPHWGPAVATSHSPTADVARHGKDDTLFAVVDTIIALLGAAGGGASRRICLPCLPPPSGPVAGAGGAGCTVPATSAYCRRHCMQLLLRAVLRARGERSPEQKEGPGPTHTHQQQASQAPPLNRAAAGLLVAARVSSSHQLFFMNIRQVGVWNAFIRALSDWRRPYVFWAASMRRS